MMKLLPLVLMSATVAGSSAALAQSQPQSAAPAVQVANPDEVVCERQTIVGSRLAHKKVCMTRSQWDEARRGDRDAVEKAQRERGMNASPSQPGG
jgi:hypothetical protein